MKFPLITGFYMKIPPIKNFGTILVQDLLFLGEIVKQCVATDDWLRCGGCMVDFPSFLL